MKSANDIEETAGRGCSSAACSANERFTLDSESGFVFDRENEKWLTTAEDVFDALSPLLPNAKG